MSRFQTLRARLGRVGVLPTVRRVPLADVESAGYHSQLGQDMLVDRLLGEARNGVFVDVGAHDGVTLSNTLFFERQRGWTGVCIEPSPAVFERLVAARAAVCVNAAIGSTEGAAQFTMFEGEAEMLSGLSAGYSSQHRRRLQREPGDLRSTTVDVPVRRLDSVLRESGVTRVDLLSVDVEGGEAGVLDSISLTEFDVQFVVVENSYSSLRLRRRMWRQGHQLLLRLGWDDVFVPRAWTLPAVARREGST